MRYCDRIGELRRCFLFDGAQVGSVETLARAARRVEHVKGDMLFMEGDEADGLRIVLSGLVRIWISDAEGNELTLVLLEPGDPFGEIALLDGMPRSAAATVLEPTTCLFLPTDAVDRAIETDPALARHLIGLLCEILRRNTDAIGESAFLGLDRRLARKVHDLALAHARIEGCEASFLRRFSQTDLALMLGVSREAVNKRLAALSHDGLLSLRDGYIFVPDLAALAARGGPDAALRA